MYLVRVQGQDLARDLTLDPGRLVALPAVTMEVAHQMPGIAVPTTTSMFFCQWCYLIFIQIIICFRFKGKHC